MQKTIMLINCDLGECLASDPDQELMPMIDQASIACGGHVGNDASMDATVALAKKHQVSIGAHPSYPDKQRFGRVSMPMLLPDLFEQLLNQVRTLAEVCQRHHVDMAYIKPHGALYHDMMHQAPIFNVVCDVVRAQQCDLKLVVQAGIQTPQLLAMAKQKNISLQFEAFADRVYQGAELQPRSQKGAVLLSPQEIVAQYERLSASSAFAIDTICFHSDHSPSVLALKMIKALPC